MSAVVPKILLWRRSWVLALGILLALVAGYFPYRAFGPLPEFDSASWKAAPECSDARAELSRSLRPERRLRGMTRDEVTALLGDTQGTDSWCLGYVGRSKVNQDIVQVWYENDRVTKVDRYQS